MAREVNTKNKGRTTARNSSAGRARSKNTNNDVTAIIIIALGILIGISMFTDLTGPFGKVIKTVMMGLFGMPAYILCFALVACSVHYILKKQFGKYKNKYVCTTVFVFCLCALWHIATNSGDGLEGNIVDITKSLWIAGGGGVIGGYIGIPLQSLLSNVGSIIVLVAVMLILLICIFEISLANVFGYIKEKSERPYEPMAEEEVEQVPQGMPPEMQRKLKKIKKEIFDFEKEFADMPDTSTKKKRAKREIENDPVADMPDIPPFGTDGGDDFPLPFVQSEVQATAEPDKEAINEAIDVAAEEALLPKKKKKAEPEQVEIAVVNDHVDYKYPSLSILKEPEKPSHQAEEALQRTARKLIETLHSFGVEAKIVDYSRGPTITRYELQPNEGVKISKITNLADDIALNLAAVGIRIEPIPGKTAMGHCTYAAFADCRFYRLGKIGVYQFAYYEYFVQSDTERSKARYD